MHGKPNKTVNGPYSPYLVITSDDPDLKITTLSLFFIEKALAAEPVQALARHLSDGLAEARPNRQ